MDSDRQLLALWCNLNTGSLFPPKTAFDIELSLLSMCLGIKRANHQVSFHHNHKERNQNKRSHGKSKTIILRDVWPSTNWHLARLCISLPADSTLVLCIVNLMPCLSSAKPALCWQLQNSTHAGIFLKGTFNKMSSKSFASHN